MSLTSEPRFAPRSIPLIYTHGTAVPTLPVLHRFMALLVAGACLGALSLAVWIPPDPRGVGTHEALGFRRCDFLARTSLPCPSCGMTTSYSHFVRGQFLASFWVQPAGFVLAVLTAASFWVALYIGLSGKPALRLMRHVPGRYYVVPLFAIGILAWGWKMFIVLNDLDGWK